MTKKEKEKPRDDGRQSIEACFGGTVGGMFEAPNFTSSTTSSESRERAAMQSIFSGGFFDEPPPPQRSNLDDLF